MSAHETRPRPAGVEAPDDPGLARALTAREFPAWNEIQVKDVRPLVALYTSRWVHRLVPTRLAIAIALVAGRVRWYTDARLRRKTLRWARAVVADAWDRKAIRKLARAACVEQTVYDVVIWRPWALRRAEVRGLERLLAARGAGRGVVIVTVHTRLVNQLSVVAAAHGLAPHVPAADVSARPEGYKGLAKATKKRNGQEAGVRYLRRGGTYPVLREVLLRGGTCLLPFDVRGTRETRVGDRTVNLARGSAELAFETGAAVIPMLALRSGFRLVCTVLTSVDPARYRDAGQLHQHIASILDQALLPRLAHTYPRALLWARRDSVLPARHLR